jgi:DNA-binding IclR family transcriptional regulator
MSKRGSGPIVVSQDAHNTMASLAEIQLVWAAVSADPKISVRCLAEQTGIKKTKAHHILHFLEDAGYVAHRAHYTGRTVHIPMIWT